MKNLLDGIVNFRENDYKTCKGLFDSLASQQNPETLFICCCDSRIDPNLITGSAPGELFIVRNIANIVPPFRETKEYVSTTSAIEYASLILKVENIIVCGHSNCGGCAACLGPEEALDQLPHTKKWLELCKPVKERVLEKVGDNDLGKTQWLMEQTNVVEQLKNLLSYPYIKDRVQKGTLTISGWYYIIETGEVFIYDRSSGEFKLAN